jgi:Uma2 family endonuclease
VNVVVRQASRSPVVLELPDVVFPVELARPDGFDAARPETWPRLDGRLEYVRGRLLYMPPTGANQSRTVFDVAMAFAAWARSHPEFSVCANEVGMKLGDDVRAADVAVWRSEDVGAGNDIARLPPVLAIEVAGRDDTEQILLDKARWYLDRGVATVWILLPAERAAIAVTPRGETRRTEGRMPAIGELPDLIVAVSDLFRQVSRSA